MGELTQGNVKACKVFLDFTNDIHSEQNIINNYIQINNIKVTNEDIQNLPIEILDKIEKLLISNSR